MVNDFLYVLNSCEYIFMKCFDVEEFVILVGLFILLKNVLKNWFSLIKFFNIVVVLFVIDFFKLIVKNRDWLLKNCVVCL